MKFPLTVADLFDILFSVVFLHETQHSNLKRADRPQALPEAFCGHQEWSAKHSEDQGFAKAEQFYPRVVLQVWRARKMEILLTDAGPVP